MAITIPEKFRLSPAWEIAYRTRSSSALWPFGEPMSSGERIDNHSAAQSARAFVKVGPHGQEAASPSGRRT